MSDPMNLYGDSFTPTQHNHGVDISSQRQDELDMASCRYIESLCNQGIKPVAVDMGGGFGSHAIRMAQTGATVYMIDLSDTARQNFAAAVDSGLSPDNSLFFLHKSFSQLEDKDIPNAIDMLYSQRAIHYGPYHEALATLKFMWRKMKQKGQVFISAAGYDTEYGLTYPHRNKTIEERFSCLTQDMQEKHAIHHKIVTYTEEELAPLLE